MKELTLFLMSVSIVSFLSWTAAWRMCNWSSFMPAKDANISVALANITKQSKTLKQ